MSCSIYRLSAIFHLTHQCNLRSIYCYTGEKLSVKPLRRCNTPVYPSYRDKNPIEHPDTLPYPFTYKALNILATAGILVGSALMSGCGVLVKNPFKFKDMNIPITTVLSGSRSSSRLNSEEARDIINKVFQEEGIYLQENYDYKKGEVRALLDGFDPKSNIGYVWIDGNKMGSGMVVSHQKTTAYDGIRALTVLNNKTDEIVPFLKEVIEDTGDTLKFNERLEVSQKITTEEEKRLAYKALYIDICIVNKKEEKYKPDYTYIKSFLDSDIAFEEKEKIFILFRRLGRSVSAYAEKDVLSEIVSEIVTLQDEVERIQQFNNFSAFLAVRNFEKYKKIENGSAQKVLAIKDKKRMAEEIQRLGFEYLDGKISLEEAKQLQGMYKGDCIAPISVRDGRFYYKLGYAFTKREGRKLEKIQKKHSKEEYHKARREIIKTAKKRDSKAATLKTLETEVRRYIRWAKLQSGN